MDDEETDSLVEEYYNDPEVDKMIAAYMKQHELDWEFAMIYGRYPEPGEIDQIRRENLIYSSEQAAKASVKPGLFKMLRYWL